MNEKQVEGNITKYYALIGWDSLKDWRPVQALKLIEVLGVWINEQDLVRSLCGEVKLIPRDDICSDLGREAAEQLRTVKRALLQKGSRCQLALDTTSTKINILCGEPLPSTDLQLPSPEKDNQKNGRTAHYQMSCSQYLWYK